jgi:hypothetical protein
MSAKSKAEIWGTENQKKPVFLPNSSFCLPKLPGPKGGQSFQIFSNISAKFPKNLVMQG